MNKDAILGFIKKNIVSLVCGVIALLCVGALFYPLGDWQDQLAATAKDQKADYDTLNGALKKDRKQPLTDPKVDPASLNGVPTNSMIAAGNEAKQKWTDAANEIVKAVTDPNVHKPLVQGTLDLRPGQRPDDNRRYKFSEVYLQVLNMDPTVHGTSDPHADPPIVANRALAEEHAKNLRNDILDATLPPGQDEIKAAGYALWDPKYVQQITYINNKPTNYDQVFAKWQAEAATLPDRMRAEVARKHKIYCANDAFSFNTAIADDLKGGIAPVPEAIWYAQLGLWMQDDLVTAIAEANGKSKNIFDAEVKRLLAIRLDTPEKMYVFPPLLATGGGMGGPAVIGAFPDDEKKAIPPQYADSPTGRYSNGFYDVMRFYLLVDVDATRVNEFIETLSHNRLITVTGENMYALTNASDVNDDYLYGPGSAVRLELRGEILYMRSWTTPLMPDEVKRHLGLLKPVAGSPGMGGQGGMSPGPGMGGMGGMGGAHSGFQPNR